MRVGDKLPDNQPVGSSQTQGLLGGYDVKAVTMMEGAFDSQNQ